MKKVSMNLTDKDIENTETLQGLFHSRSKSETVSTAISITSTLANLVREGGEILVKNKNGKMERIHIAGLE